jgi:hypothetical protein
MLTPGFQLQTISTMEEDMLLVQESVQNDLALPA